MQKKLLALAVAGLVSAPAFAQSNVTIYGIVDMSMVHHSGSSTHKSRTAVDSGQLSGSRIGFRGVEDLGNGLKAAFVLEYGLATDQNAGINNGARQQYLALAGNFGTVAAGRQYTPQHTLLDSVDPFTTGTVGNVYVGYQVGVYDDLKIRLDNTIAYISPDFGGLTVTAAYTANGIGDEEATLRGNKSDNAKVWALSPVYTNGPLLVGLNYHQIKVDGNYTTAFELTPGVPVIANGVKNKVWDLAASYDFGPVKLAAVYGQNKLDADIGTLGVDSKRKQWMVGATVPVSEAGKVLVSYTRFKIDGDLPDDGNKGNKWALGYTHDLSKRTNLYAVYASTSNDLYFGADNGAVDGAEYDRGFNIGIRHAF